MTILDKIDKYLNEKVVKYKGMDIKKQNRKDGLPYIIPALQKSASSIEDAKKIIDKEK